MQYLEQIERKLIKYPSFNPLKILIGGQVLFSVLGFIDPFWNSQLELSGNLVLRGEYWRLVSFLFVPIIKWPFFLILFAYAFFNFGKLLEESWGSWRLCAYVFISYMGAILGAFLFPYQVVSNIYLFGSIILAFAYTYNDVGIKYISALPIKVKWIALILWVVFGLNFLAGNLAEQIIILLSLSNYWIFFAKEIVVDNFGRYRHWKFGLNFNQAILKHEESVIHKCAICGKTDKDDPNLEFRYCTDCSPPACFCTEHLDQHQCIV